MATKDAVQRRLIALSAGLSAWDSDAPGDVVQLKAQVSDVARNFVSVSPEAYNLLLYAWEDKVGGLERAFFRAAEAAPPVIRTTAYRRRLESLQRLAEQNEQPVGAAVDEFGRRGRETIEVLLDWSSYVRLVGLAVLAWWLLKKK